MAEERRPWHKHPLVRRAPILLVAAVGIWLFRSSALERELIWQLPPDFSSVVELDLQLRDAEGDLVRTQRFFPQGAPPEVTWRAKLPEGDYQAQVFLKRTGQPTQPISLRVRVEGERTWVNLARPPLP